MEDTDGNDVIKLARFKEYKFKLQLKDVGHYHFVCGLPHVLNISRLYQKANAELRLQDKLNKLHTERSKYTLKLKLKVYNKYVTLLKEKRVISMKGNKIQGEVHFDFNIKPKYLVVPMTVYIKLTSHSLLKKLQVSAALYKDMDDRDKEKDIMRSFLSHVFERDESDHQLTSIGTAAVCGKNDIHSMKEALLNSENAFLESSFFDGSSTSLKQPNSSSEARIPTPSKEEEDHFPRKPQRTISSDASGATKETLKEEEEEDSVDGSEEEDSQPSEPSEPEAPGFLHPDISELSLSHKEKGRILITEIFEKFGTADTSRNQDRSVIDIPQTKTFQEHIERQSERSLKKAILNSLWMKYPRVTFELAANPYKEDSYHHTQEPNTFLNEFQIQTINYECIPRTLQYSTWVQRYNSNIFGHNLNEIIRLCCTSSEPQLIIITSDQDFIFGGFLKNGLYMKNSYNKDAVVNFPCVYHNNFSLANYDMKQGYSEAGSEDESFVFSYFKSTKGIEKFPWTGRNRMFRMVNQKGIGMGGGGEGFAFFIDATVQFGSSSQSETYDNKVLSHDSNFAIRAIEIWGLQSSFTQRKAG